MPDCRRIPLGHGLFATVDADKYARLRNFKWRAQIDRKSGRMYAVRSIGRNGKSFMHREILNARRGEIVDHRRILHTLRNTRWNLRIASKAQNNHHKHLQKNNSTGYIGVSRASSNRGYQARISVDGRQRHLGYRDNAQAAGHLYDTAARLYYGEFAQTNFTKGGAERQSRRRAHTSAT